MRLKGEMDRDVLVSAICDYRQMNQTAKYQETQKQSNNLFTQLLEL